MAKGRIHVLLSDKELGWLSDIAKSSGISLNDNAFEHVLKVALRSLKECVIDSLSMNQSLILGRLKEITPKKQVQTVANPSKGRT